MLTIRWIIVHPRHLQRAPVISFLAIAWSSLYEQLEFDEDEVEEPLKQTKQEPSTDSIRSCNRLCALLAVALKCGYIVLWKVELPAESEGYDRCVVTKIELFYTLQQIMYIYIKALNVASQKRAPRIAI